MASKAVSDREGSARAVISAAETHGPSAAATVEKLLATHLKEGETLPSVSFLLVLFMRNFKASIESLVAADLAHEKELRDDPDKRVARDVATTSLSALVASIRLVLTRRFGEDFGAAAGVTGNTPQEPKALVHFARNLLGALEAAVLPAAADDDDSAVTTFDKSATERKLRERTLALEGRLDDVAREEREAEHTQAAKNKALERSDFDFAVAASFLELLLTAAGESAIAKKVRPARRQPGVTGDSIGETEPPVIPTPPVSDATT